VIVIDLQFEKSRKHTQKCRKQVEAVALRQWGTKKVIPPGLSKNFLVTKFSYILNQKNNFEEMYK